MWQLWLTDCFYDFHPLWLGVVGNSTIHMQDRFVLDVLPGQLLPSAEEALPSPLHVSQALLFHSESFGSLRRSFPSSHCCPWSPSFPQKVQSSADSVCCACETCEPEELYWENMDYSWVPGPQARAWSECARHHVGTRASVKIGGVKRARHDVACVRCLNYCKARCAERAGGTALFSCCRSCFPECMRKRRTVSTGGHSSD